MYKPNRAVAQAGGDYGPVFSATGQLPTNTAALHSIRDLNKEEKREAETSQVTSAVVPVGHEVSESSDRTHTFYSYEFDALYMEHGAEHNIP